MKEEQPSLSATAQLRSLSRLLDPAYIILAGCVVIALSFLVSVNRKNSSLLREVERLSKEVKDYAARAGDPVQPFNTVDLEGKSVAVELPAKRKQLFFIFSSYCSACATQHPVWNNLAGQLKGSEVVVRGVSLDSLADTRTYFKNKSPGFPVVIAPDESFSRIYRVDRIPQVMLISEQGVVEWAHTGALSEGELNELVSKLGPGANTAALNHHSSPGGRN